MSTIPRSARHALIILSVCLSLLVVGFSLTRLLGRDEVLVRVVVADVDLRGLDSAEATEALADLESRLAGQPAPFLIEGREVTITGEQVGLEIDETALTDQAMALGRQGNVSTQFRSWLTHLFSTTALEMGATIDQTLTDRAVAAWNTEMIGEPPFEGGIRVEGGSIRPDYPRAGRGVDPVAAATLILDQLSRLERPPVELPVVVSRPVITDADVDAAVAQALNWTRSPINLRDGEVEIRFAESDLVAAIRSEVVVESPPRIGLFFDEEQVATVLDRLRGQVERPPVDATFDFDGYQVVLVPGHSGTLIDPATTARALVDAVDRPGRNGILPLSEGAQPAVTTADLAALDIKHLVSSFTTYHDCCQNRVVNIHLFADTIDGAIVRPGESLDLNEFVGQRTREAGYLEDGTIEQGEMVKTVGGGVSQFATTFYNAVFWGGYEDVTHKPHSFHFSRYPEGIEATISWPAPDLEFRNDSDSAILIKTEYTDTSITVKFYGNNDGRVVVGSHRDGRTSVEVKEEGGPEARRVDFRRSERFSPTEPVTRYRENPAIAPGEQKVVQSGAPGWSVKVTRIIEVAGTATEQEWVVRYLARPEIIEVHPCSMPEATETCPTTTTVSTG